MRFLSPRKTPVMGLHRASGKVLVRFVERREGRRRGPVQDVYLGLHGSDEAAERYEEEIREWVSRSLRVGWAPAGWRPATTGHDGVLTVEDLVEGYRRHLDEFWGSGWRRDEVDPDQFQAYREARGKARELIRQGRPRMLNGKVHWVGDRQLLREGKQLAREARRLHGHLDAAEERLWAARVLEDLVADFGPISAAVVGDRELRQLRRTWAGQGQSLADRKAGMEWVRDAYYYVIGREPWAPWDLDRVYLERHAHEFGLDLGSVGPDGRWVRSS